jgi:hypothetical protein
MLVDLLRANGIKGVIQDIDATDPRVANEYRFPGSPTIRVNDVDVESGFEDPGEYTPRCRFYLSASGPKGLPDRRWIEEALQGLRAKERTAAVPVGQQTGTIVSMRRP